MESLDGWFGDEEHPENISKKAILKEIFEVAKAEERFQKDVNAPSAEVLDSNFEKGGDLAKEMVTVPKLGKEYQDLDTPLQEASVES